MRETDVPLPPNQAWHTSPQIGRVRRPSSGLTARALAEPPCLLGYPRVGPFDAIDFRA